MVFGWTLTHSNLNDDKTGTDHIVTQGFELYVFYPTLSLWETWQFAFFFFFFINIKAKNLIQLGRGGGGGYRTAPHPKSSVWRD